MQKSSLTLMLASLVAMSLCAPGALSQQPGEAVTRLTRKRLINRLMMPRSRSASAAPPSGQMARLILTAI
jgi:hypothetical protein